MKYCDDASCPHFGGDECKLGFKIKFRVPRGYGDIQNHNWGWVMAKACRKNRVTKITTSKE